MLLRVVPTCLLLRRDQLPFLYFPISVIADRHSNQSLLNYELMVKRAINRTGSVHCGSVVSRL